MKFSKLKLMATASLWRIFLLAITGPLTSVCAASGGLYITEIYPNDINRSAVYGNSDDHLEYVELTNTTDSDISFNEAYALYYELPSGEQLCINIPCGPYPGRSFDHRDPAQ